MSIRRSLVVLGAAALCLALVPGVYAQRGRGGGGGAPGGGFRGNSNPGGGRPATAPARPSNAAPRPDRPESRGAEKKSSGGAASSNSVASQIEKNPRAAANVERLLPVGMTLDEASEGFKNRGQFIAALHVSKNLNIPFTDLKARMTGEDPMSLGKSIHALKPDMNSGDVDDAVKTAEKEARETENPT
ncbi:MAG TPA: hypothetical protein VFY29_06075 [Terriglobia bacterium]|nr:hypothetical protein [Terriglobia bacterium]